MLPNVILKYCSQASSAPPYEMERHMHEYWELVYYGGLGISTVGGIPFNYIAGSYVVIPAKVPHSEKAIAEGTLYCLGFEADMEAGSLPNCLFFDDSERLIQKTLDVLVREVKEEQPYHSERVNLLLRDLLLQTMRKCAPKMKKTDEKLDMIINYIDAYYTMDIDFKMLANSLNYSYDYLRHYFKAQKKMSLKQYVIQRRISLAKEQLASNIPIASIAQRCGFYSPAHFSAVFRQCTGMTPTQYHDLRHHITGGNETILCDSGEEDR